MSVSGRRVRRYTCRRSAGGCGNGIAADRTDDLIHEMWAAARPPAQIPAAAVVEEAAAEAADWADTVSRYVGGDLDADTLETRRVLHAANVVSLERAVIAATPVSTAAWMAMRIPERRRALLHRFAAVEIAPAVRSGFFDPTRIHAVPNTRGAAPPPPAERISS